MNDAEQFKTVDLGRAQDIQASAWVIQGTDVPSLPLLKMRSRLCSSLTTPEPSAGNEGKTEALFDAVSRSFKRLDWIAEPPSPGGGIKVFISKPLATATPVDGLFVSIANNAEIVESYPVIPI